MLKIVVLGGGTSGWLTSLFVQKYIPYSEVTVVASSEMGILGAGEGTTAPFMSFLDKININPDDIIKQARGTIKTGIKFNNWNGDGKHYYHNFLANEHQGDTALHFDARLLAKFLESVGIDRGIKLIDDKVTSIKTDSNNYITSLTLENGEVDCDFVFDCSGFRRMIIGQHYKSPWISYNHLLPVNRAMPFFVDNTHEESLPVYTEAVAMKHGWIWKIPVQGRYGCGYVFDKNCATDEEIKQEIEEHMGHSITVPQVFNFMAGCYENTWIKNCIAIGLSSGFTEPLEATSIWVQTECLTILCTKLQGIIRRSQKDIDEYNLAVRNMNSDMADFLYLHYLTKRKDTEFWRKFEDRTNASQVMQGFFELAKQGKVQIEDIESLKFKHSDRRFNNIRTFPQHSWDSVTEGIEFYQPK